MTGFMHPDQIRSRFSREMSDMYRKEVPLYGDLIDLVKDVNSRHIDGDEELLSRVSEERHGAIRLGTGEELSMMRRVFGVMGMQAVGYYDLSIAGLPIHSTAFRPITAEGLQKSPFRVFTSFLRLEEIKDEALRLEAERILAKRQVFSEDLIVLTKKSEEQGGLSEADVEHFISEALKTFQWHKEAAVSFETYERFKEAHPILADIVCFKGPHINHLTPRTLDIDEAQARMVEDNTIQAKALVEGPPKRNIDILLRQTSFKALTEDVVFTCGRAGKHTARFGEIEQRGVALTPKGRALYDELLAKLQAEIKPAGDGSNLEAYLKRQKEVFTDFPDTEEEMKAQELAYVGQDGEFLTYEDFLPVSAAGIFLSNAAGSEEDDILAGSNKDDFEKALGDAVLSEFGLYQKRAS